MANQRRAKTVRRPNSRTTLLAGGNPKIAKADGDAPVQAYLAAMPGWKRGVGQLLDTLIVKAVPGVHKAVKWNSPFYGAAQGWFVSFHCYAKYVKVAFFNGVLLDPLPPGDSRQAKVRYLNVHESAEFDQAQFQAWVVQASQVPGWPMGSHNPSIERTASGPRPTTDAAHVRR